MIPSTLILLIMLVTLIGVAWMITDNTSLGITCFIAMGVLTLVLLAGGLAT